MHSTLFKRSLLSALVLIAVTIQNAQCKTPQNNAIPPTSNYVLKTSISAFLYQAIQPEYAGRPVPCSDIRKAVDEAFVRGSVDLILLCESFNYADTQVTLELVVTSGYRRALRDVKTGSVDTISESVWKTDLSPTLKSSVPVIEKNTFKKGIFTLYEHSLQRAAITDLDLNKYIGISVKNWHQDWSLLNHLTQQTVNAGPQESIYKMISAGRADFTLMELSVNNMSGFSYKGTTISPIKGAYVTFDASRHFIISENTPNAEHLIKTLNTGLARLKNSNKINEAYEDAGHQSKIPQSWVDLSQRQLTERTTKTK